MPNKTKEPEKDVINRMLATSSFSNINQKRKEKNDYLEPNIYINNSSMYIKGIPS